MNIRTNGVAEPVDSLPALEAALDRAFAVSPVEFWIECEDGPQMSMLRNGPHAWLMYLRHGDGDWGFCSLSEELPPGTAEFTLSNGQVDEHPLAWCIPLDQCRRAIHSFFETAGGMPRDVVWLES